MDSSNRRSSLRIPVELKAWVRSDSGVFVKTRTLDINADGAMLELPRPASHRLAVNLKVQGHLLALQAHTVWTRGKAAGIRFVGPRTVDLARLWRWHHTQSLLASGHRVPGAGLRTMAQ